MSRDRLYTWAGLWRSPSSSWEALRLEDDQAESQLRAPDERSGLPYQLDYRLRWDADWHLREAVFHVESETGVRKLHLLADGRGHWQDGDGEALPAFDGCLDIDIWPSPFTNTFPIRRLAWPMASARKSARSTSRPRPWSRVACARHTPAWTPATTSTRTSKAARSKRYCWWTNRAW